MRSKDHLKLDRYDGTTNVNSFLNHFRNCAEYNRWNREDKLSQLKAALKGEAAEILLESGSYKSYSELVNDLIESFGTVGFEDQYESQLKTRRRLKGESLRSLYQDINRLVILAYPNQAGPIREKLAIDSFLCSLCDTDLELLVRNTQVSTLKQCYQTTMRLESNRMIVRGETRREGRREGSTREMAYTSQSS